MTEPTTTPQILIDTPPGFAGLPLTADAMRNEAAVHDLARRIAEHDGQHSPEQLASYLGVFTQTMGANNIRLFGRFAVGGEEPALATLALAVAELADPESEDAERCRAHPTKAAEALVTQFRQRHPDAHVQVVRLNIGPALGAVVAGDYVLPPELTGQETSVRRPVIRAEFQIPAPDGAKLITMSLTTDNEDGWPAIARESVRIANTIRYQQPVAQDTVDG
ncbi:hypothetical protein EV191_105180 [Tamaricihabitans halophyticus]|uniref:Uncharacterized protein n=1 Tax=Tamaricihabitans halophyticus TaxID=1262583 RepID=A0A4R2QTT4_9PSEU|nr:hypothetical protein [Tamaricihabitans halophyticus]TCP53117.1 hypothetical protein EV191_105180 [Tamaricihabitans halophyticus]